MARGIDFTKEDSDRIATAYLSGLTTRQVAAQYGVSASGVKLVLRRRGSLLSSGDSRVRSLHDYDLSLVKEILDGELLGDGTYSWSHSHNACRVARFEMCVSLKHREHVEYLHAILGKHFPLKLRSSTGWYNLRGVKTTSYRTRLFSLFSRSLAEQKQRWYPNGKKQVPSDLVLTPVVLRHWYYGDGSMSNGVLLCSDGFSDSDLDALQAQLLVLGFPTKRYPSTSGRRSRLHMGIAASRCFLKHIGPCEISCYRHKWIAGFYGHERERALEAGEVPKPMPGQKKTNAERD